MNSNDQCMEMCTQQQEHNFSRCLADQTNSRMAGYSRTRESNYQTGNKQRKLSQNMDTDSESSDKENEAYPTCFPVSQANVPDRKDDYMMDSKERQSELEKIIFKNLFTKEIFFKLVHTPKAMYVQYRHLLVEWMTEVCDEYHLPPIICHLSVRYLDEVLGREKIAKKNLQLVALCCILVAAKYREPETNIPTVEELNECTDCAYTADLIKKMEMSVLKMLKWTLGLPTAQDFLMYYMKHNVIFKDDRIRGSNVLVSKKEATLMPKYVKFFAELSILEYSLQSYTPSLLASAIICCSRSSVCLVNEWNDRLALTTGYTLEQLKRCRDHLYKSFVRKYPNESARMKTL